MKQNKPTSVRTTLIRLRTFFPDDELTLAEFTSRRAASMYMNLARAQSVDSHRNILSEARTFIKWCVKTKNWLATNPLAGIEAVGKRKHGKPQLRIDEARRWMAVASQLAAFGRHWRDWPRKQVQRICELAQVPTVCAHSMRGLHSTLAIEAGTTSHVVAASLGHESPNITLRSYVAPGTTQQANSNRVLTVLKGEQDS